LIVQNLAVQRGQWLSHKRTPWGCRGCSRVPNAEKLAIIRAKIFNFWAKYTATFTRNWGSVYFPN